jgi:hypothetical protein
MIKKKGFLCFLIHNIGVILILFFYVQIICKIWEETYHYVCFDSKRIAIISGISYLLAKAYDYRYDFVWKRWQFLLLFLVLYLCLGLLIALSYQIAYLMQPIERNSVLHIFALVALFEYTIRFFHFCSYDVVTKP